jgi:hypothetical protein
MASIASVYVDVLPVTGKIADGIAKALREADADVIKAAKRWRREIDRELGEPEVEVDADTTKAKKEIEKVEKGRYHAEVKVDVDEASLANLDELPLVAFDAGELSLQKAGNLTLPVVNLLLPQLSKRPAGLFRQFIL